MASNVFLTRQVEGAGATALRMVGAEPTPELISMVEQLAVGDMVMRDEYGRLGVIHVAPPVDPRTARAFDTRPRSGQGAFVQEWEPTPGELDDLPEPFEHDIDPRPDLIEHRREQIEAFVDPATGDDPGADLDLGLDVIEAAATTSPVPRPASRPHESDGRDLFARLEASFDLDGADLDPDAPGWDELASDEPDSEEPDRAIEDADATPGERRLDLTSFVVPRD